VRTWLRRAIATDAAVVTMPMAAVVSNVTPYAGAFPMRARDEHYGWDSENPAFEWVLDPGVATVMSVGGQSSFHPDWYSPSSFNTQPYTYKPDLIATLEG
jgi:diacylglycerol O-acyltransferase/trehalose O-mycolyltransferase